MVANNTNTARARFSLGQTVATPGALAALEASGQTPMEFLARHVTGDWGDLDMEDKAANENACAHEGDRGQQQRILSAYRTGANVKLWVITEWDRSVTTLLLPRGSRKIERQFQGRNPVQRMLEVIEVGP